MVAASWHPAVPSAALRAGRNIVSAMVTGQELALWRSDQGTAQAWENRCPHRGVRLSLGRIIDGRLSCAYHGWEYAADSGRCVAIPAMPEIAVPGRVCATTFAAVEAQGMVWVRLGGTVMEPGDASALPTNASDNHAPHTFCQSLALNMPIDDARSALQQSGFASADGKVWSGALAQQPVRGFLLQADAGLNFLHLWCSGSPDADTLRTVFAAARRLRSDIESVPALTP